MAQVEVKTRDGEMLRLDALPGAPLMEALRDGGADVDGTCGGMCSCGTCHVYVADAWIEKLAPRNEDESMMLEALEGFVSIRPGSRLACQIVVDESLEGLQVEVAPEA